MSYPRTLEESGSAEENGGPPSGAPHLAFSRGSIPESRNPQPRPSPALDPLARMRLSNLAKWGLLIGFLLLFLGLACWTHERFVDAKATAPASAQTELWRQAKNFAVNTVAAIFAATVATCIPRLLLPHVFGRWREMVEAARDWIVVGVTVGVLYTLTVVVAQRLGYGGAANPVDQVREWLLMRLPVLLLSGWLGLLIARRLAIHAEGLLHRGSGNLAAQVIVQILLIGLVYTPFHDGFYTLVNVASPLLTAGNLTDPRALAGELRSGATPLSRYVRNRISREHLRRLTDKTSSPGSGGDAKESLARVLQGINELLYDRGLYAQFGAGRPEHKPRGSDLVRRNRLLLENAYPRTLAPKSPISEGLGKILRLLALGCLLLTASIIVWAGLVDKQLKALQRQGRTSGHVAGAGPVELTLTIVGGRESGKTVLLAGAYYEWSYTDTGPLRIEPAEDPERGGEAGAEFNLAEVSRRLYSDYEWPLGTVICRNLPFDLCLGEETVARFHFLDYPGGAVGGNAPDRAAVQSFWDRVDDTDAVVLVADMSYVRRGRKDPDWFEVMRAYKTVMQRLAARNGRRRVVPVALVLTKCDEFVDPHTGVVDEEAMIQGLQSYGYDELEATWRSLDADLGPGFVEYSTWPTSAITYSRPRRCGDNQFDMSQPFEMKPPPPPIVPTGCASPLLWISAKAMRWNVTLFSDLSSFLLGSSPRARRHIDAILEMEELATRRAAG